MSKSKNTTAKSTNMDTYTYMAIDNLSILINDPTFQQPQFSTEPQLNGEFFIAAYTCFKFYVYKYKIF